MSPREIFDRSAKRRVTSSLTERASLRSAARRLVRIYICKCALILGDRSRSIVFLSVFARRLLRYLQLDTLSIHSSLRFLLSIFHEFTVRRIEPHARRSEYLTDTRVCIYCNYTILRSDRKCRIHFPIYRDETLIVDPAASFARARAHALSNLLNSNFAVKSEMCQPEFR